MDFYKNMKKGAIIVAHFGTTHEDTKEKTIDIINEKISKEFTKLDFFQIYTSRIINRILSRKGIENLNTSQMLEKLKKDNYSHIIIQPTYIINGTEMEALKREVEQVAESFDDIRIGTPLLTSPEDYFEVVKVLSQESGNLLDDEAVVLVGHGTEHSATSAYPMLDYVARDLNLPLYVGTVEGYPTAENVIKQLKRDGKNKIILKPLMFVAGDHAKNDIAEDWKNTLENEGYEVTLDLRGLGEMKKIQDIFIEKAKNLENNLPKDILKKKADYAKGERSSH
ncbi:sirohydrochlorin cobaltochelatase [uncultured Cetobacterium sp.]|uniref:sirohydrochlorin cobaltochelatase n=1 Tax=uncultured Cetobacterium sp. TaxID=527638 RepID=UPI00260C63C0|nr:sirohydrochlorin cobaltochelatase [uncultured Cetobacterium sp.]